MRNKILSEVKIAGKVAKTPVGQCKARSNALGLAACEHQEGIKLVVRSLDSHISNFKSKLFHLPSLAYWFRAALTLFPFGGGRVLLDSPRGHLAQDTTS